MALATLRAASQDLGFLTYLSLPDQDNLCLSPASFMSTLLMVLTGTTGVDEEKLKRALLLETLDQEAIHKAQQTLTQVPPSTTVSHAVFAQHGIPLAGPFEQRVKCYYHAKLIPVDFRNGAAVAVVNDWVNTATRGKIPRIADSFPVDTTFCLMNVIYFKELWKNQFDPKRSYLHPFHVTRTETVQTKMMTRKGCYRRASSQVADCDILELPYQDNQTVMLIFHPHTVDGLPRIEQTAMTPEFFIQAMAHLLPCDELTVAIPAFTMTCDYNFKEVMSHLGLGTLILYGSTPNILVDIYQKTFIEVNEAGTTAVAATLATFSMGISPSFIAVHPFMYVIMNKVTGNILFLGRLKHPKRCDERDLH